MVRNLAVISITWVAMLAGCADTPRAAYNRMLQAFEQCDPNALTHTVTGPPECIEMMRTCVIFGGALNELERKVIAVRGQEQWAKFAEAAGIGGKHAGKERQGPSAFAHMGESMLDFDKAVFVTDGDNAIALEPGEKVGPRLVRIEGKWYVDLTPDKNEASGDVLLTMATAVKEMTKETRELARKFDDPKFDIEQAGKAYSANWATTMFGAVFSTGMADSMRKTLAEGDVQKFWRQNSRYDSETSKTHPIVCITPDAVTWGPDRTPMTLAALAEKIGSMTRGKLMDQRQIVVEKAKDVPDGHVLKVLRALVDAGALPMCVSPKPDDSDGQPDSP